MEKECKLEKEYNVWEIICDSLRAWWLVIICALLGAVLLGGYKYLSNRGFVSEKPYEDVYRVTATFYVKEYSGESAAERTGTIIKTADSRSTYECLLENTGYDLEFLGFQHLFDIAEGESSDILTVYVNYPGSYGGFSISDETAALDFANEVIIAIDQTTQELIGQSCMKILDAPYVEDASQRMLAYAPSETAFRQEVAKAATAGILFGVIVEVALHACWRMIRQKRDDEWRE